MSLEMSVNAQRASSTRLAQVETVESGRITSVAPVAHVTNSTSTGMMKLPDELLLEILKHLNYRKRDLISLSSTSRRWYPPCKRKIWRYYTVNTDTHHEQMDHLSAFKLVPLIERVEYSSPKVYSVRPARQLSSLNGVVELHLSGVDDFDETDSEDGDYYNNRQIAWPRHITNSLRHLSTVTALYFTDTSASIKDPEFSLGEAMPQLVELNLGGLEEGSPALLDPAPPAVRRLCAQMNDFLATAVGSMAKTVEMLSLRRGFTFHGRDGEVGEYLRDLGAMLETHSLVAPLPLRLLCIEQPEIIDEDGIPSQITVDFLATLGRCCTSLSVIHIGSIPPLFDVTTPIDNLDITLPSVKKLELFASSHTVPMFEGIAPEDEFLDETSHLFVAEFLKCFPNLDHLILDRWLLRYAPEELCSLANDELQLYSPTFYALLEVLDTTSIKTIEIRWEPGLFKPNTAQNFDEAEVVTLVRKDDGKLEREFSLAKYSTVWPRGSPLRCSGIREIFYSA